MGKSILYISYDGLLEPLGYSQVFRYMQKLSYNFKIIIISFEKNFDWKEKNQRLELRKKIKKAGIIWIPLRYHNKLGVYSTTWDLLIGFLVSVYVVLFYKVKLVHVRSYVPAIIGLALKKILQKKMIFDMRGFWADERVDVRIWPNYGKLFRLTKWFERRFLLNSDIVISLTKSAVNEMKKWDYIKKSNLTFEVIPTCADLEVFRLKNTKLNKNYNQTYRPFILGYVGSVGVWYLFDEVIICFKILKSFRPNAKFHIINKGEHSLSRERLKKFGILENDVIIETTNSDRIVNAIQNMNIGVFFIMKVYSKLASSPTKFAEFLGCGVPCLTNSGIGDLEDIINSEKIGIVLRKIDETSIRNGLKELLLLIQDDSIKQRCVNTAKKYYSLEMGVDLYSSIYRKLLNQ